MVISKTIMSHATCNVGRRACVALWLRGVHCPVPHLVLAVGRHDHGVAHRPAGGLRGLLAGDAERRLGLGDRGVAGDLGLLDGLVGLGLVNLLNRLVVELARRVLELASLAKVARLGEGLGG